MKTRYLPLVVLSLLALTAKGQEATPPALSNNPAATPTERPETLPTVQWKAKRFGGRPTDIVFDGDSITNRFEDQGARAWATFAARAADFGIEGDRVENDLWRLDHGQVDGMNPKLVVLLMGTNNVSGGYTPDQIADGIRVLVSDYEKRCPQAHIVLMAIFPRGQSASDPMRLKVAAVNNQIKSLADGNRVSFLDLTSQMVDPDGTLSTIAFGKDFLHPQVPGYVLWARALEPYVDKYAPAHS
jgi:beta-glucosidase